MLLMIAHVYNVPSAASSISYIFSLSIILMRKLEWDRLNNLTSVIHKSWSHNSNLVSPIPKFLLITPNANCLF